MAYAAVISLKHNIERLTRPRQITKFVHEKLNYLEHLLQVLDTKSDQSFDTDAMNAVDAEIRKAVWKLEDVLESYTFYHSLDGNGRPQPDLPLVDYKFLEQEMGSFIQTAETLGSMFNTHLNNPLDGEDDEEDEAVSPIQDFGGNKSTTTIGLSDDYQLEIIDELRSGRETVSFVGMAGIGKTHVAREIYQHPIILQHFAFRAWVIVGQKRRVKSILVDVVAQIESKPRNLYLDKDMYALSAHLKEILGGGRCLIVLDDVWSAWTRRNLEALLSVDGVTRIMLTTRVEKTNEYQKTKIHQMRFLDGDESWDLLWRNVFAGDESFPSHLEKVGKKIAVNCEGLPLLILAVAGLLSGLDETEECWSKVASKKSSIFMDAYDKISEVLFSSYEYLPQYLKTCFLYLGVFPQSCEIPLSKIINLWTVEDFLQPHYHDRTVADLSVWCVEQLVSNSLVIVCERSYARRIKSCKLHSAYWYLCVKEARKNKFLHVLNRYSDGAEELIESQRRLSVQNNILFAINEVHNSISAAVTARSLLCTGTDHEYPVPICFNLMLLRVLDAVAIRLYLFPEEVVKLLLLRYLAITHNGKLPPSISKLQQLQFLIVCHHHNIKLPSDSTCLPEEIWHLQELTHLQIVGRNLPDPSYGTKLPKLSTLYVNAHSCSKAVLRSIPNLKKLGIQIELHPNAAESINCFKHVMLLSQLKSLKCVVVNPWMRSRAVARPKHFSNFPRYLTRLSLNGLGYSWKYTRGIGSLPYLKVLKLRCYAFQGPKWETEAGEFQSLEFLLLEDIDVVEWTVCKDDCFPRLQCLTIRHCFKLKEIPPKIGDIPTLKTIEVDDCSPSVVASAEKIQEKRSSVQFVINSSWKLS